MERASATSVQIEMAEKPVDPAPESSQAGDGAFNSVGPQDLQNIRLLIDIGGRTIEIPLKGKLVVQTAAAGGENDTAADEQSTGQGAAAAAAAAVAQKQDEDRKYLDQMRGWLITVATLFTGIAFQAAIQPPAWIPKDWGAWLLRKRFAGMSGALAALYMIFNATTFTMALFLVVTLLTMKEASPTRAVNLIAPSALIVASSVFSTFALGMSNDPRASMLVFIAVLVIATVLPLLFRFVWILMPQPVRALYARACSGPREHPDPPVV